MIIQNDESILNGLGSHPTKDLPLHWQYKVMVSPNSRAKDALDFKTHTAYCQSRTDPLHRS